MKTILRNDVIVSMVIPLKIISSILIKVLKVAEEIPSRISATVDMKTIATMYFESFNPLTLTFRVCIAKIIHIICKSNRYPYAIATPKPAISLTD